MAEPDQAESEATAVAAEAPADGAELPPLTEALEWTGSKLDEIGGGSVGRIEGVYVDAENGEPVWLLIRMGRFGHHSAIPYSHAVAGVGRVWAPYDRDMVRQAPRIDAGQPLTRERELELCHFYGYGESRGRGAEVAKRPEGAATAQPASPRS